MENLTSLPGDNEIQVPFDPSRAELILPDNEDKIELKLPDEVSPLGETFDKVRDLDPIITAQKVELAKRINEPELYVDKNFENLKKIDFDRGDGYWAEYQKRNPIVSEKLKDPKIMAMAKNDIDKLADIEKTVQDKSFASDLWNGLQKGLATTNAQIARIPSLAYNLAAFPQNVAVKAIGRPDLQVSAPDAVMDNPIANFYDKQASAYSSSDQSESISDQISKGDYRNAAKNLAVQVVTNSPSQMISIMLGLSGAGLVPALAVSGSIQGAGTLKESIDKGADPTSATLNAAYQGTFEAGMESLSFGTIGALKNSLSKAFGEESARKVILEFGKEVASSMASEGKEEFLTQIAQDFSSYATGVDTGALNGTLGRALDAGLIGAASGGAMNAPISAINSRTRLIDIKKTEVFKKQYSDLGKKIVNTDLSKSSPDTQAEILASLTEGTQIEHVYLPVEEAQKYFQSKGLSLEAIGKEVGIEGEVNEAIETGADIKIPLAKWASKLASTEHYEALKDDIKYSPEDFTSRQNKDLGNEIFDLMNAEVNQANESQKLTEEQKAQSEIAFNDLKTDLINRGQDESLADKNARIYQAYVTTRAALRGISVEQSHKEIRPEIRNAGSFNAESYQRNTIPAFDSPDIVDADQVREELKKMGMPEAYQSDEAISAIRSQLAFLKSEISQAEAGKRTFREGEIGGDVKVEAQKSTFPKWFSENGFKTKKEFEKFVSKGNSKNLSKVLEIAIKGLKEGYGESSLNLIPPNLDFVALVDPESLDGSIETERMMAQRKEGKFFQTDREIRNYLDSKVKGKAIILKRGEDMAASEIDTVTGQLTINADKLKTPEQIDQVISQFGEAKKESITGKIETKIDGETIEVDAKKAINALAKKLYNLERLSECSR
jgi:hypothetical protein